MKRFFLTITFVLAAFTSQAQVGVSYLHSDVISSIGISTNPDKTFWGEARVGLDINFSDFSPEFLGFANIIRRDDFNFFVGAGLRVTLLEGPIIPATGFTFKPIQSKPNFSIHAEGALIAPFDTGEVLRGSIGIRYFIRKK